MNFSNLRLARPLLKSVHDAGYASPSPIQVKAIPPALEGRDVLACAQTGTGKTAAFALPILQLLSEKPAENGRKRPIRALILTPTRELALQIKVSFDTYGKNMHLKNAVIFGGVGQAPQVEQLRSGIDILVATPGRLYDLIGQKHIRLDNIEIFVLDEADRMLDMGFVQDVKKIMKLLPQKKQTLLFSATMPGEIVNLADSLLHNPAKVYAAPVSSTAEKIEQKVYKVSKTNKRHLLKDVLLDNSVVNALVFTRTKHGADKVSRDLNKAGISAMAIHGNKSQNARQNALEKFKNGSIKVLVATDIAARGLDISGLSHVVNFDLPNIAETYVHRIGRTGRAGKPGIAVSFCSADELEYLQDIEKLIGFKIPEITGHNWELEPGVTQPEAQKLPDRKKQSKTNKDATQKTSSTKQKLQAKPKEKALEREAKPLKSSTTANNKKSTGKGAAPKKTAKTKNNPPSDPYSNLTGGRAIVTRRPIWSDKGAETAQPVTGSKQEGDITMSRDNRRRGGKDRGKRQKQTEQEQKQMEPKPENGIYDFSEEELSEDKSIKVISRKNSETKFANFDEYLKNQ